MAEINVKITQNLVKEKHPDGPSQILTPSPSYSSEETSPIPDATEEEQQISATTQKKKKKKSKKSLKAKEAAASGSKTDSQPNPPPVLCISRNKHWRYISSYHVRRSH